MSFFLLFFFYSIYYVLFRRTLWPFVYVLCAFVYLFPASGKCLILSHDFRLQMFHSLFIMFIFFLLLSRLFFFLFCPFHFFLRYKFFNVPCMNWFLPPVYTRVSFSHIFFSTPFSIFIIFGHPLWWIFHSMPIYMKINEREEIKMGESASILAIYAERARAYS